MDTQLITETNRHEFNDELEKWSKRGYKPQGQLTTCPCKEYCNFSESYRDATRYSIVMVKE